MRVLGVRHWRLRSGLGGDRSRGQAMVEFAFAVPVFLLLFVAVFDFGLLMANYQGVSSGAWEGARVASIPGTTNDAIVKAVTDHTVLLSGATVTISPNDVSARTPGTQVQVKVTYDYVPLTPMIANVLPGGHVALSTTATVTVE